MKVALIDMDGVIANEHHRRWIAQMVPSADNKDKQGLWDSYHKQMVFDEPFKGIINDVNSLPSNVLVVILTGRPEKYRVETINQLDEWKVRYDNLIMRKDGDKQSAVTMKKRVALNIIEIGLDIVKAIDDHADICAMYRKLEIPTVEITHE